MAKKSLPFKTPTIVRCQSGDWYIQYYFRHPDTGEWKAKKSRGGINYLKDPEEKEVAAEDLRKDVLAWLKAGNSPFANSTVIVQQVVVMEKKVADVRRSKNIWSVQAAIEKYDAHVASQNHEPTTVRTYKKYTAAFLEWLTENELLEKKARQFTEMEVQTYLDDLGAEREWAGRTYNNYLDFMVTFFTEARRLEKKATNNRDVAYEFNPEDLKHRISKAQRNKALTPKLFNIIKKKLNDPEHANEYRNLKDYLEWIYLSLMRPAEIRELKVIHIDEVNRQIRFKGKTGDRIVPISDQLMNLIERRGILNHNLRSYIFGWAGEVDIRRMSVAYFLEKFSDIKKPMGLDANYGPYSYKPTGVIKLIKAGFSDKEIMELTGHKTESAFSAYKRDLVIENSHAMKGSTIDF